ncbi:MULTISPECIES: hypothetical protein [unclassified Coleofasciculus]|uniref:hypothetical protein n=1 Tax=unclassified Coleofasciculus TaxID=2692782 RepID=UPI001880A5E9|nr:MULTISPECIES: hypothetical protein [unclassified Coleofasciculus]MBE9128050.1 hypothetical protein [Coleofasciculus sp. LEGE 07081]MBE9149347.1 hypothetical protein [Coleofasciculus sp. LEGE 07092]
MILCSGCFDQIDQVTFQTCTDAEKTVDAAQKDYQQFLYGLAKEDTEKEAIAQAVVMETLKDAEEEAFRICEGN